jgi:hypothetical protein
VCRESLRDAIQLSVDQGADSLLLASGRKQQIKT